MSTFHDPRGRWYGVAPPTQTDDRLPPGLAALVICGLSALCWTVLVSAAMALPAIV